MKDMFVAPVNYLETDGRLYRNVSPLGIQIY